MASKAEDKARAAARADPLGYPGRLGTRAYWAFRDEVFDMFMETRVERLAQFRELVAATGGPRLDGSAGSMGLLDDWLAVPVSAGPDWDDGADWLPVWGVLPTAAEPLPWGMDFPSHYRLKEWLALYHAEVLIGALPGSKWVCWRAEEFNLMRTGDILVDIGTFPIPADPFMSASYAIGAVRPTLLDPSDPEWRATRKRTLVSEFEQDISMRRQR
ncbi:MAG: hypothetical protein LBD51_07475, partial [Bifidobacteriaceae bacterium]|nr:hypothetical protein [Bifidobacteriaceae bacterium]